MSQRAVPFHCPYCGEENLFPHAGSGGNDDATPASLGWECRSCLRAFQVTMLGLIPRPFRDGVTP